MTWDYMLKGPDTVQKDLLLQDLLKALHFLKCYTGVCSIVGSYAESQYRDKHNFLRLHYWLFYC